MRELRHAREEGLALSRWCVGVVLLWGVGATELTPPRRFAQWRVRRYCVRDEHARLSTIGLRAVVHARVRERLRTRLKGANIRVTSRVGEAWEDRWHGSCLPLPRPSGFARRARS